MYISLPAFAPENLVSRDGFGGLVPRHPAHLHTQAESGAYLRDSSRAPRRRPFIYFKPPYAIGSVPSLSGHHAIAYRWHSLPRVHRAPRRRPFIYFKPPYAIESVPSLSGHHAIAYRWHSLPRVHRHRASEPQGSSGRVLPRQVTMDQLICTSFSHTHYWDEVGMLKVPAITTPTQLTPPSESRNELLLHVS